MGRECPLGLVSYLRGCTDSFGVLQLRLPAVAARQHERASGGGEDYEPNYFGPCVGQSGMTESTPDQPSSRVRKSDQEWREKLTPAQYEVLRLKGSEPPFTGRYLHESRDGIYRCAACRTALFSSDTKFDSGTGWPSFTEPAEWTNIELHDDHSYGMHRVEVTCAVCSGHLGHVFGDGPGKTGQRFCINSASLELDPR